jgi:2-dehydropantoate 2-reductase
VSNDAEVLIIGGGAIGGVLAALLAGSVARLVVLDPAAEHTTLLRDPGLRLEAPDGNRTVPLDARTTVSELDGRFDFALVTVKATHLEAALTPVLATGIVDAFVSLGNGMVQDRVGALVGVERMMAGVIEWGATNLGPGHLRRTSLGPVLAGEMDGSVRERTTRLIEDLAAIGDLRLSRNVRGLVWTKLLLNSTFAGLGAISGLVTGDIVGDPEGRAAALALWGEGYSAAIANGIELEPVFGSEASALVAEKVGREQAEAAMRSALEAARGAKASMLQDLEAGRPTEVDVINGAVAEQARAAGVRFAVNQRVVDLVHEIERGERVCSPELLTEVAALGPA